MERDLYSLVAFFVLPAFVFTNSGIDIPDIGAKKFFHGVTLGTAFGLLLGKKLVCLYFAG